MRINIDCLRDVLLYCINNLDYIENGYIWECKYIDLDDMYKSAELKEYQKNEIMYSVLKLKEVGYIITSLEQPKNQTYINSCLMS